MKKTRIHSLPVLFAAILMLTSAALPADFSGTVMFGYNGGPGLRVGGMVSRFAQGLPLSLEISGAYTRLDPGDPMAARRIFINNNTNGTPEESGVTWDARLDFLYRTSFAGIQELYLLGGVRYAAFIGDFKYVGGNEDFEVTGSQWGLGLGARAHFPISRTVSFVFSGGFDYYFKNALEGHDTEYTPENQNINPQEDYTYADADAAINQPRFQPVAMIGVSVGF